MRTLSVWPVRCLAIVGALMAFGAGCGGPDYPQTTLPHFACRAPRAVVFEALVRRAEQLGYEHANVDPMLTEFAVYAHSLSEQTGRRSRERPSERRPERANDDLLIVRVSEDEVRVHAFGPHVIGEDHMHPEIAMELQTLAHALRDTTNELRAGGLSGIAAGAPSIDTTATSEDEPAAAGGELADP